MRPQNHAFCVVAIRRSFRRFLLVSLSALSLLSFFSDPHLEAIKSELEFSELVIIKKNIYKTESGSTAESERE